MLGIAAPLQQIFLLGRGTGPVHQSGGGQSRRGFAEHESRGGDVQGLCWGHEAPTRYTRC